MQKIWWKSDKLYKGFVKNPVLSILRLETNSTYQKSELASWSVFFKNEKWFFKSFYQKTRQLHAYHFGIE